MHDVKKFAFILHGQGNYLFANGDRFEGSWVANRMHGRGVHIHKSGTTIEGTWHLGQLEAQTNPVEIRYFNGDSYVGKIHEVTGGYHGQGTFVYKNGTRKTCNAWNHG